MLKDNLENFIKNHAIVPKKVNGRSYIFDCPVCNGNEKLYINKDTGQTVCFRQKEENCPKNGSKPTYALSLISGISFNSVKDELYNYIVSPLKDEDFNISFDDEKDFSEEKAKVELMADMIPINWEDANDGIRYLIDSRGISEGTLNKYKIYYSPSMRRVIFPVIINGNIEGWQGRAIDNVDKAYRMYNMPGRWRDSTVMFFDNLKKSQHAIIAEGAISALKFDLAGGFVATMGKAISDKQLELIANSGVSKVYLALDRDAFDKVDDYRLKLKKMNHNLKIYKIPIPKNRDDFGDCSYSECLESFNSAEELDGSEIIIDFD